METASNIFTYCQVSVYIGEFEFFLRLTLSMNIFPKNILRKFLVWILIIQHINLYTMSSFASPTYTVRVENDDDSSRSIKVSLSYEGGVETSFSLSQRGVLPSMEGWAFAWNQTQGSLEVNHEDADDKISLNIKTTGEIFLNTLAADGKSDFSTFATFTAHSNAISSKDFSVRAHQFTNDTTIKFETLSVHSVQFNNKGNLEGNSLVDIQTTGSFLNEGSIGTNGLIRLGLRGKSVNKGMMLGSAVEGENNGEFSHFGTLYSREGINFEGSGHFINDGIIDFETAFQMRMGQFENKKTIMRAGDIEIACDTLENHSNIKSTNGSLKVTTSQRLFNAETSVLSGHTASTVEGRGVTINEGVIEGAKGLNLTAKNLTNKKLISSLEGLLNLEATKLDNEGVISSLADAMNLSVMTGSNSGKIFAKTHFLGKTAGVFRSTETIESGTAFEIQGTGENAQFILDSPEAVILSNEAINFTAQGDGSSLRVLNKGAILAKKSIVFGSGATLSENNGSLKTSEVLSLSQSRFTNKGVLAARKLSAPSVTFFCNQEGSTVSLGKLTLASLTHFQNQGTLQCEQALLLKNLAEFVLRGKISSKQTIGITSVAPLENWAEITGLRGVTINAPSFTNHGTLLSQTGEVLIEGNTLINYGRVSSDHGVTFKGQTSEKASSLTSSGTISSQGDVTLNTTTLTLSVTPIQAKNIHLNVDTIPDALFPFLTPTESVFLTGSATPRKLQGDIPFGLHLSGDFELTGPLNVKGFLSIQRPGDFTNTHGIRSLGLNLDIGGMLRNGADLISEGTTDIKARDMENWGLIYSQKKGTITVSEKLDQKGNILGDKNITISANEFLGHNSGGLGGPLSQIQSREKLTIQVNNHLAFAYSSFLGDTISLKARTINFCHGLNPSFLESIISRGLMELDFDSGSICGVTVQSLQGDINVSYKHLLLANLWGKQGTLQAGKTIHWNLKPFPALPLDQVWSDYKNAVLKDLYALQGAVNSMGVSFGVDTSQPVGGYESDYMHFRSITNMPRGAQPPQAKMRTAESYGPGTLQSTDVQNAPKTFHIDFQTPSNGSHVGTVPVTIAKPFDALRAFYRPGLKNNGTIITNKMEGDVGYFVHDTGPRHGFFSQQHRPTLPASLQIGFLEELFSLGVNTLLRFSPGGKYAFEQIAGVSTQDTGYDSAAASSHMPSFLGAIQDQEVHALAVVDSPHHTGLERLAADPYVQARLLQQALVNTLKTPILYSNIMDPFILLTTLRMQGVDQARSTKGLSPLQTSDLMGYTAQRPYREIVSGKALSSFQQPSIVHRLQRLKDEFILTAMLHMPETAAHNFYVTHQGEIIANYLGITGDDAYIRGIMKVGQGTAHFRGKTTIEDAHVEAETGSCTWTSKQGLDVLPGKDTIHTRNHNRHYSKEEKIYRSFLGARGTLTLGSSDGAVRTTSAHLKSKEGNIILFGTLLEDRSAFATFFEKESWKKKQRFRSSKKTTVTRQSSTPVVSQFDTPKNVYFLSQGDALHEGTSGKVGGKVYVAASTYKRIAVSESDFYRRTTKKRGLFRQSMRDQGVQRQRAIAAMIHGDQGDELNAQLVIVDVPMAVGEEQKDLKEKARQLMAQPEYAWLESYINLDNVHWDRAQETYQKWNVKQSSFSPGFIVAISILVAIPTHGMATSLMASAGLTGTTAVVASAAFTAAVTQSATSLVIAEGNVGKMLHGIASSDFIKNIVIAAATAGILDKLGLGLPEVAKGAESAANEATSAALSAAEAAKAGATVAQSVKTSVLAAESAAAATAVAETTFLQDIVSHAASKAKQAAVSATVRSAVERRAPDVKAFTRGVAADIITFPMVSALGANSQSLPWSVHKAGHFIAGGFSGMLASGSSRGFSAGGFGAAASEILSERLFSPSQYLSLASQRDKRDYLSRITSYSQAIVSIASDLLKVDPAISVGAATRALEYNFIPSTKVAMAEQEEFLRAQEQKEYIASIKAKMAAMDWSSSTGSPLTQGPSDEKGFFTKVFEDIPVLVEARAAVIEGLQHQIDIRHEELAQIQHSASAPSMSRNPNDIRREIAQLSVHLSATDTLFPTSGFDVATCAVPTSGLAVKGASKIGKKTLKAASKTPAVAGANPKNRALYEKYIRDTVLQQQRKETGTIIAGASHQTAIRDVQRLISQYGGAPPDWVKKSSTSYRIPNGNKIETHWYENVTTGERYDFKTKTGWPEKR